jgi:hypothetical protein
MKFMIFVWKNFYNFITNLNGNYLYSFIPLHSNDSNKPYIVLSRSFLVTNYSSYRSIHHFTFAKYHEALEEFYIEKYNDFIFFI